MYAFGKADMRSAPSLSLSFPNTVSPLKRFQCSSVFQNALSCFPDMSNLEYTVIRLSIALSPITLLCHYQSLLFAAVVVFFF